MSKADELKSKNENLFERNTILLNENERLKKENAELKAKKGCETCTKFDEVKLTKAKEIISAFVEWANWQGGNCPSFKSIQDKAEQFLKEIEK